MTPPVLDLEGLISYFEAAFETCAICKGRLGQLGEEGRGAVREVGHLQRMIKQYLDALYETRDTHLPGDRHPASQSPSG